LRVHREPAKSQRRVLQAAAHLLRAGTVIWVTPQAAEAILIEGQPCLSAWDAGHLLAVLTQGSDWQKAGCILCNQVQGKEWGQRFPRIYSLLALPTADQERPSWLVAFNKQGPADAARGGREEKTVRRGREEPPAQVSGELGLFRRSDAALLSLFVALLEMHGSASSRYQTLKELLVGLTRSLTAAIDAKDAYTFGHSERVARIALEVGRELKLTEEELNDIYLAGLLHDIGKIGIPDAILTKRGPLAPEERKQIEQHVTIGYKILADLRPIRHLLAGVLYHHERYDGTGYPEGLAGEAIPFLARILAVADSYDAMSTSRPYRGAIPYRQIEETLLGGAGQEWDRRVIEAFLHCRERIQQINARGVGESLGAALDGALRTNGNVLDGFVDEIPPQP
jgi:HD-GYP domain-containing protein (c-di-GMP phosphodiesterase class II)